MMGWMFGQAPPGWPRRRRRVEPDLGAARPDPVLHPRRHRPAAGAALSSRALVVVNTAFVLVIMVAGIVVMTPAPSRPGTASPSWRPDW